MVLHVVVLNLGLAGHDRAPFSVSGKVDVDVGLVFARLKTRDQDRRSKKKMRPNLVLGDHGASPSVRILLYCTTWRPSATREREEL
jgi:hypothetical protein